MLDVVWWSGSERLEVHVQHLAGSGEARGHQKDRGAHGPAVEVQREDETWRSTLRREHEG